jgi:serine/threonine protein kinase/WD40 repeat protein
MASGQPITLLDRLRQCDLLDSVQLEALAALPEARDPDPRALGRVMLRRGWLTRYQINQVAQGRASDLIIGPYVVLDRLGEGGMGQVFRAQHRHMQRLVALKVIRKERLANDEAVKRFYQEVQAAAQLHHPNIVVAYDAGRAGNTHFFAMELIDGTDLSRLVRESGRLPVGVACEYVRQAAIGLQHANERNLVHRDIKPANLLLGRGEAGAPLVKILDMGLARLHSSDTTAKALTQTGQVMGTPDYLAPEQAIDARSADIRSDLYSLGCTLYYLLNGRPPFSGDSLAQILLKHQMAEPAPPEGGWEQLPPGVQKVLRKLLAKQPEDRYQTPRELADALQPLCAPTGQVTPSLPAAAPDGTGSSPPGEVISAHPSSGTRTRASRTRPAEAASGESSSRTSGLTTTIPGNHRRLLLVGTGIGLGAGLLVGLVVVVLVSNRQKPASQEVVGRPPPTEQVAAVVPPADPKPAPSKAPDLENAAPAPAPNDPPKLPAMVPRIVPTPAIAPRAIVDPANPPRDEDVPVQADSRMLSTGTMLSIRGVAITPDGRFAWLGGDNSQIVELPSARRLTLQSLKSARILAAAFSPDSRRVVTYSSDHKIQLWKLPEGTLERSLVDPSRSVPAPAVDRDNNPVPGSPHGQQLVPPLAFSSDGKLVATGHGWAKNVAAPKGTPGKVGVDGGVRVWDVAAGKPLTDWSWPDRVPQHLAFNRDGTRLYGMPVFYNLAGADGTGLRVFDVVGGKALPDIQMPQTGRPGDASRDASGGGPFLSPDGGRFLVFTYGHPGTNATHVWDLDANVLQRSFVDLVATGSSAWCGPRFILMNRYDRREEADIIVRDADSGRAVRRLRGHNNYVRFMAASADGRRVISGGIDGTIRVWETPPAEQMASPSPARKPAAEANDAEAAPGGSRVIFRGSPGGVEDVEISPDGRYGWIFGPEKGFVELPSGRKLPIGANPPAYEYGVAFSPDNRRVLTYSSHHELQLRSLPDGALEQAFENPSRSTSALAFSPDGKLVATGYGSRVSDAGKTRVVNCGIRVWDAATGKVKQSWDWPGVIPSRLAFNRDATRLYGMGFEDGKTIRAHDVSGDRALPDIPVQEAVRPQGSIVGLHRCGPRLSPDGRLFVVGVIGFTSANAYVWDLDANVEKRSFLDLTGLGDVAWCGPRRVLTTGPYLKRSGDIIVRDAETGRELRRLTGHTATVTSLAASDDGRRVLSGSTDGTVRCWDVAP